MLTLILTPCLLVIGEQKKAKKLAKRLAKKDAKEVAKQQASLEVNGDNAAI